MLTFLKRLETLIAPGNSNTPSMSTSEAEALKTRAFDAGERGDHDSALELWLDLMERRPDWTIGFAGGAVALRRLRRWDESRRVLQAALVRFPREAILLVELGRLALDRHEFEDALALFRQALGAAPGWVDCHVSLATSLYHLRRFDEADAVLETAMRAFPDAAFVFSNYGVSADLRGDRPEAVARWRMVNARFPQEPVGYAGLGAALKMIGRFDEADSVLREGMHRFPDDANIAINHAWVRVVSADWDEALRRWTAASQRWPQEQRIKDGLSETVMHAGLAAADGADVPDASAFRRDRNSSETGETPASGVYDLMLRFESVGENCELGFVQRRFGAEPLGMFRWAGIKLDLLLQGLASDFAGVGTDEQTLLAINPSNREYYTQDRRYEMHMHSFILEGDTPAAIVKAKMCRRLLYLKDKFLQDLRDGEKIFVFNSREPLSEQDLRRLHDAMRRYGPARLLSVAPDEDQPAGSITVVDHGLWRGHLGRTGFNGRIWDIEFDSWLSICRAVSTMPGVADGTEGSMRIRDGQASASAPA